MELFPANPLVSYLLFGMIYSMFVNPDFLLTHFSFSFQLVFQTNWVHIKSQIKEGFQLTGKQSESCRETEIFLQV